MRGRDLATGLPKTVVINSAEVRRAIELVQDSGRPLHQRLARAYAGLASTYHEAGRHDLAQGMGEQIKIQVEELIAHADEQRTQGDLRAAVDTLSAGLRKAPGNLALLPAAASAMLKQLDDLGWEAPLAEQCQFLLERMRRLDPGHPSLETLLEQYQHTQRKYGISVTA